MGGGLPIPGFFYRASGVITPPPSDITQRLPEWLDYAIWRPVAEGMGSLVEVEEGWTILDLQAAHSVLNARARVEAKAAARGK